MGPLHLFHQARHHAYSIWLFTRSDIKTIILPSLLFSLLTAPALALFDMATPSLALVRRLPLTLFWIWINLLPFAIDNQRQADAIAEDGINKPWRTLPSRRMTPRQATVLMCFLYPTAVASSLVLGGLEQCLCLIALGFWYNDLRGADNGFVIRQVINAAGFNRFATGALAVLLGDKQQLIQTRSFVIWQLILAGIVSTTVQTQDMYDQEGDAKRGRHTVPLDLGDGLARWTIAVPMVLWCTFCPLFIACPLIGFAISISMGSIIALRCLVFRSVASDKVTFIMWNSWLVSIYSLPLLTVALNRAS
ncbi:hypothetical protein CDD82_210 [Ophiocordyceps australis]|uniref:UbiA prenyltransferase n=1 Tax=Ophiocordyceps australis TaxID=1399860 RepID=A0A2C5ZKU7_9HYPO|nr:hypothetical protein CDD82_210 [Ophiocordyceps australis]